MTERDDVIKVECSAHRWCQQNMAECRLATESGALPWGVLVPHQDRRVTQMPVGFAGLDYSPMQHLSFHFSALSSSGQHRTLPFVWVVRVVQFDCKRMHPRTRLEPIGIDKCQSSAVVCADRAILKPCWPLSPPHTHPPRTDRAWSGSGKTRTYFYMLICTVR